MRAAGECIPSHQRHWIRWKMNPIRMDFRPIDVECLRNHCTLDLSHSNRMSCRQSLDLADRNRWSPKRHPIRKKMNRFRVSAWTTIDVRIVCGDGDAKWYYIPANKPIYRPVDHHYLDTRAAHRRWMAYPLRWQCHLGVKLPPMPA